jgi:hypothetical protein
MPDWRERLIKQGRVLYMVGEGLFDFSKRISAWQAHHKRAVPSDQFKVIEPAPLLRSLSDRDAFIAEAKSAGPWDLVIIDTIGRTMPGINDNVQEGGRLFSEFTVALNKELGAATLAITHSPKDNPSILLGSGAFEADADVTFNCTPVKDKDRVDLHMRKPPRWAAPWKNALGFRSIQSAESIVLEQCEPSRTAAHKEDIIASIYEAHFKAAFERCIARAEQNSRNTADASVPWADVMQAMLQANADDSVERGKLEKQYRNWFNRWPGANDYRTGERGKNYSPLLGRPKCGV